jgi:hypothetical protein
MSDIKEGNFAFYQGKPVAIEKFFVENAGDRTVCMAEIRYIQRTMNNKRDSVFMESLLPFTEKAA